MFSVTHIFPCFSFVSILQWLYSELSPSLPPPHIPTHRHYIAAVSVHKPAWMSLNRYTYVESDFSRGIAVTRL